MCIELLLGYLIGGPGARLAAEQLLDARDVVLGDLGHAGHPPDLALRLDLHVVGLATLGLHDLAGAGHLEPLLGTAVGLLLRHDAVSPSYGADPQGDDPRGSALVCSDATTSATEPEPVPPVRPDVRRRIRPALPEPPRSVRPRSPLPVPPAARPGPRRQCRCRCRPRRPGLSVPRRARRGRRPCAAPWPRP